ncbi:MAG TPA: HU family DNA-binding protein [Phycisphaerales bacterium]|nr:HU family DNA-binding protein [Phycisphaerales bacterium]
MSTLTKKDFVDSVAHATGLDREQVRHTLQVFLDHVTERLGNGERIEFRDFGVFEVRQRAARTAQNPKTLQRVSVPPRRTVKFKPGRLMKDMPVGGNPLPGPGSGGDAPKGSGGAAPGPSNGKLGHARRSA